jgi:predicted transglutaminase-like cysteine proteinase
VSRFSRAAAALCLALLAPVPAVAFPVGLFGYRETPQADIGAFPQWAQALERELADDHREPDCAAGPRNCELRDWRRFIAATRDLPPGEQLARVNRYGNEHPYVLDIDNYGREDYWAVPREFLPRGGDCEDFVITKYFSLRALGYPAEELRIVVVQDTNLRIPHAVLAVARGTDIWVLDNQVDQVRRHRDLLHYAPVYSINDRQWWLHVPR